MASFSGSDAPHLSGGSWVVRRKTTEACERCREKRIKCDGLQPCNQCQKKNANCDFAIGPSVAKGHGALTEKLDLILNRLDQIENRLSCMPSSGDPQERTTAYPLLPTRTRPRGLAQLNQQTGCFEYYGRTSTFVAASSLVKRLRQLEDTMEATAPAKLRRKDTAGRGPLSDRQLPEDLDLDELTGFCDYVVPPNAMRSDRYLRVRIADRHLDSFFKTIHIFIPLFDEAGFREKYMVLRVLFGDRRLLFPTREDPNRPQLVCLLYAVMALGALYENEHEDSSSWASWYFAEAQDMLGRLLEAADLQLVQAALFLGAYAQHALKPNLAYILTGCATRLALSIGLHIESVHSSLPINVQEARRTCWMLYIQEVELSLDSGRPMSLPPSEMIVTYPAQETSINEGSVSEPSMASFIGHLADIAKIIRKVLDLANNSSERQDVELGEESEALRIELMDWRARLPEYLWDGDTEQSIPNDDSRDSFYGWKRRQQSSILIHYNLAIIILLRSSLSKSKVTRTQKDESLTSFHQMCCLDAARDMVKHIHKLFQVAPRLKRWSYYCFYCLHSVLVLLHKIADDSCRARRLLRHADQKNGPISASSHLIEKLKSDRAEEDRQLCHIAMEIFEEIDLKASQRCAEVVRTFLGKWKTPKSENFTYASPSRSTSRAGTSIIQSPLPLPRMTATESLGGASILPQGFLNGAVPVTQISATRNAENLPPMSQTLAGNITSPGDGNADSPSVSLTRLQADLYMALFSNSHRNDGLGSISQPHNLSNGGFQVVAGVDPGADSGVDIGWPIHVDLASYGSSGYYNETQ